MDDVSKGIIIPLASLMLGVLSVLSTSYIQLSANDSNLEMKMVEITYNDKKQLYTKLLKNLDRYKSIAIDDYKSETSKIKDSLRIETNNALIDMALFVDKEIYIDCEDKINDIRDKAWTLFYTKIDAAYLSPEYEKQYFDTISSNISDIRNMLRKSLVVSNAKTGTAL